MMLTSLLRNRITLVWAGLLLATLASWELGASHGLPVAYAGAGIIVIAFVKVWFVGCYFMELRNAPRVLVTVFSAWTVLVALTLVGLLLFA